MHLKLNNLVAASVLALVAGVAAGHDEVIVASDNSGRLIVKIEGEQPVPMSSTTPGFEGLAGAPLGLTTVFVSIPEEGLFALPANADIVYIITSIQHGLTMYNDLVPMNPGDSYALGQPYFHNHPVWQIAHPHSGESYTMTGYFRDLAGTHTDSAEFTVSFLAAPAPCFGDADGNGAVNFNDITTVLANIGVTDHPYSPGDADGSGTVNFADVSAVLASLGSSCS